MKTIFAAAALATVAVAARPTHKDLEGYTFEKYVADFKKGYAAESPEFSKRRAVFNAALAEVKAHNARGGELYKKGINDFSDWTSEELRSLRGTKGHLIKGSASKPERMHASGNAVLPKYVDWRTKKPAILSGIKSQGDCGSCWAHAATETIEAHWALATGELYVLSQQQVTSCTPTPHDCGGTGGCNGAIIESAFDYIANAGGQVEEWEWSYTSYFGDSGTCSMPPKAKKKVAISGYTKVPHNDAAAVMDAVAHAGPLAINVDASGWGNYELGVFDGCSYSRNITIDHGVQLVGYGHDLDRNVDYWLIRNSWSASWGELGYMRLLRRPKAECGWNVKVQDGDACKGQTAPEWACGMCGMAYDTLYPNPKLEAKLLPPV